ncbi:MAG: hypothetical protein JST51_00630 [Armatimonadetes bacterium]|nr:hypothetical protein [Armatimonadota bacterium]
MRQVFLIGEVMIAGFLANLAAGTLSNIIGDIVAGKYNSRTTAEIEELIHIRLAEYHEYDDKKQQRYAREILDELRVIARSVSFLNVMPGHLALREDQSWASSENMPNNATAVKWRSRIREFEHAVDKRGKELGLELSIPSRSSILRASKQRVSTQAKWQRRLAELPSRIREAVDEADNQ